MSPSVQQLSVIGNGGGKTYQPDFIQEICSNVLIYAPLYGFNANATTHCQRTAHTPSGVAPGSGRLCACHLEDTPLLSGLHQLAAHLKRPKPIGEGEK